MSADADTRHAARMAAVQAIYQMELTGHDAEDVAREFIEHRFVTLLPSDAKPDESFFEAILNGVPQHQVEIDRAIAACLASNWRLERVDSILRAILRAAAFEMIARADVPARVVIDEYIDIASAFFHGDEPGFVNAALDRMGRIKRAPEFGLETPDGELRF